jgi:aminoglycoside 3-N-acetyltransferase
LSRDCFHVWWRACPKKDDEMKRKAADDFSTRRVMADISAITGQTRWQTMPKMHAAARHMAESLKSEPGLEQLRLIELPADGKTFYGGWVMPKCWDATSATLRIATPGVADPVLADYQENPWSLMMWSPATPPEGIEAEVVHVAEALKGRPPVKGKFALVDNLAQISVDVVEWLAKLGAVGLLTDYVIPHKGTKEGNHLNDAAQYRNYTNPQWDGPARLPAFGLTPNAGARLRRLMAKNKKLRLRAHVDARLYDGAIPLVNARLQGQSGDEIILTAHMDEPGVSDNGSGTAVAMEVMRVLARHAKKLGRQLRRTVRLLSSVETRGIQAFLANQEKPIRARAGLDLDMIGCDPRVGRAPLVLTFARPATPSFLEPLLTGLAEEEAARGPGFIWKSRRGVVGNDCHFALLPFTAPMCELTQAFDRTYHTNLDRDGILSTEHITRMGRMICKAVLFLADAGPAESAALAGKTFEDARKALSRKGSDPAAILRDTRLMWAELQAGLFEDMVAPNKKEVELLRGKKLLTSGGLGRKAEFDAKIAGWSASLATLAAKRKPAPVKAAAAGTPREINAARACVPVKTFTGYFSFEDLSPEDCAALTKKLGFKRGWGAPEWMQWALNLANGKRSLLEIHEMMNREKPVELSLLLRAFAWLHDHKRVRHRPIITRAGLLAALRKAGVREGDILMAHTALSDFGYFDGGADCVIDTLLEAVGPKGTVAVPTHSLNWVGALPYDPKTSRSLVGAITNQFLKRKNAVRSLHPTHSVAAIGPMAEMLVAGHDHTVAPQAREGFWGNLVKFNGKVLLMCKQDSNTLLHAGELWGGAPLPSCQVHFLKDGSRVEATIPGMPWHTSSFKIVHERLAKSGLLKTTPLGESRMYLLRAQDGVDAMLQLMRENPLTPTKPDCNCRWCTHIRANLQPVNAAEPAHV